MALGLTVGELSGEFDTVAAGDLGAALESLHSEPIDVVVADSASGGKDLITAMAGDDRLAAVPLILLSDDESAVDGAAFGHLLKTPRGRLQGPVRTAVRFHRWVRRHRDLIEGVPIGIVSLDLDGRILEANRTLGQIARLEPTDMIGRRVADLDPTIDWPALAGRAARSGLASVEWPRDDAGGTTYLRIDLRPAPGRDGRIARYDGIVEDITDRKRREHTIARTNEQLAALYEVGTRVSGTLELEPVLQTIATEARRLVDADWSRITLASDDTHVTSRAIVSGDTAGASDTGLLEWVHENAKTAVATDAATDPRAPNGPQGPLVVAPLVADGAVNGTLEAGRANGLVFSDLEVAGIEILAGQASIAIRNARFFHDLTTSHASLQEAHFELGRTQAKLLQVQRLESIGELAAGIAHEINTPIQYVADNTRFLGEVAEALNTLDEAAHSMRSAVVEGTGGAEAVAAFDLVTARTDMAFLTSEASSAAEQALEGIERVAGIVRALKEFAHPGTEGFTPVDINRAVTTTIAVARNEWKYVADLETDLGPGVTAVPGLSGPLNQAVLNILVNAAHAVAETSKVTGQKGTITITTRRTGDRAVIAISDTGPGIPAHVIDRIYDPFFTTKGVGRGSGQGLAIARNAVVDQHGGELEVTTEVGVGTTFTIKLPLERPKEES